MSVESAQTYEQLAFFAGNEHGLSGMMVEYGESGEFQEANLAIDTETVEAMAASQEINGYNVEDLLSEPEVLTDALDDSRDDFARVSAKARQSFRVSDKRMQKYESAKNDYEDMLTVVGMRLKLEHEAAGLEGRQLKEVIIDGMVGELREFVGQEMHYMAKESAQGKFLSWYARSGKVKKLLLNTAIATASGYASHKTGLSLEQVDPVIAGAATFGVVSAARFNRGYMGAKSKIYEFDDMPHREKVAHIEDEEERSKELYEFSEVEAYTKLTDSLELEDARDNKETSEYIKLATKRISEMLEKRHKESRKQIDRAGKWGLGAIAVGTMSGVALNFLKDCYPITLLKETLGEGSAESIDTSIGDMRGIAEEAVQQNGAVFMESVSVAIEDETGNKAKKLVSKMRNGQFKRIMYEVRHA